MFRVCVLTHYRTRHLGGIRGFVYGFVSDVEIQVVHPLHHPPLGLVSDLGRLFDGNACGRERSREVGSNCQTSAWMCNFQTKAPLHHINMAGDAGLSISERDNTHMMERWTAAPCSLRSPVWCTCKRKMSYLIKRLWAAKAATCCTKSACVKINSAQLSLTSMLSLFCCWSGWEPRAAAALAFRRRPLKGQSCLPEELKINATLTKENRCPILLLSHIIGREQH